jgi:hypothetical protein
LFFYAVLIGLLIGRLRKGKFEKIGYLRIKYPLLIVSGIIIQISIFILKLGLTDIQSIIPDILLVASYIVLLVGMILNVSISYMYLVLTGAALNFIMMSLNGFRTGITLNAAKAVYSQEIIELLISGNIRYFTIISEDKFYMGGFIPLSRIFLYPAIMTIGDVILYIGMILMIQKIMTDRNIRKGKNIRYSRDLFR